MNAKYHMRSREAAEKERQLAELEAELRPLQQKVWQPYWFCKQSCAPCMHAVDCGHTVCDWLIASTRLGSPASL
jgi:hypothetical protein